MKNHLHKIKELLYVLMVVVIAVALCLVGSIFNQNHNTKLSSIEKVSSEEVFENNLKCQKFIKSYDEYLDGINELDNISSYTVAVFYSPIYKTCLGSHRVLNLSKEIPTITFYINNILTEENIFSTRDEEEFNKEIFRLKQY